MSAVIENDMYRLTVSDDEMRAELMFAPTESGIVYTVKDTMNFLFNNNIRMGVIKEKIEEMVDKKILYQPFVVAEGKPQVDGENGHYQLFFEPISEIKPQIKEDGSVDYLNTKSFVEVHAGDKIAEYIPATMGEFGFNIRGKLLSPKKGRELTPLRGRGVQMVEEGIYEASISGKIEYKYGDINIYDVYDFSGDLDMSHSHIRFPGDVRIHGDVDSGMIVDALGNVEIDGHVAGATIKAGKNILIRKGVQGMGRAIIEAKGNVCGQFFEDAHIIAENNIEANYLMNCDAYAGNMVHVHGRQGVIIGGQTHGVQGVEAQNIGNEIEVPTLIRVGIGERIMKHYAQIASRLQSIDDELKVIEGGIIRFNAVRGINGQQANNNDPTYTKLLQVKIIKNAEKNKNLDERKNLFDVINQAGRATLGVHGDIYPGTKIMIDALNKKITSRYTNTRFKMVDGAFAILPMD